MRGTGISAFVRIGALALAVAAACGQERPTTRDAGRSRPTPTASDAKGPPPAPATAEPEPIPAPEVLAADPFAGNPCRSSQSVAIFHSPRRPTSAGPLRVIAVAEEPAAGAALVVRSPDGRVLRLVADARGGPPWSWVGAIDAPGVGSWKIGVLDDSGLRACRAVTVRARAGGLGGSGVVWRVERGWDRATENLWSAWIERLFDAPPGQRARWTPLHAVTRDPARNFLWGHMGLGEDDASNAKAIVLNADCADTPYFLRAYFAWKLRLPFQYSTCEVPAGETSPRCTGPVTNDAPREEPLELDAMNRFLRRVADTVHSGSLRTLPDDDATDVYPIVLSRESIRPGALYADPHGHVLVVVAWQAPRGGSSGALWAIDGNPDRHVGRKKFWRGTFGFLRGTWAGAPGFKEFRPIALEAGTLRALPNGEIRGNRAYGNYSGEQHGLTPDAFYERIERLVTPTPIDAERAFDETMAAFHDLVGDRVDAVAAGEAWRAEHLDATIGMPPGAEIFATQAGPWEDYSTPSRDLQLLVAMDVLTKFPDVVARSPDRFVIGAGRTPAEVSGAIRGRLDAELRRRTVEYARTGGRAQRLTLADVVHRAPAFEMAYNPNDCVEVRWGASPGTEEYTACVRHASAGQVARMNLYRRWFARRQRPPRTH